MVDLETINLLVQIVGVSAAAIATVVGVRSYIVSNKRAQETRDRELETQQAQLFMQVYNNYLDKIVDDEMTLYRMEYKDYDDFMKKYGWESNPEFFNKFNKFVSYLEGVGVLVKRGLIDQSMVYDLNGGLVRWYWEKSKPFWVEFRVRNNEPDTVQYTEYLYERLRQAEQGKSSLGKMGP
jgi:hypothetical protein